MTEIISPKVYEILKKAVQEDIENYKVTVHDKNKKGEGYLGEIFFISLEDKRSGKNLHLVVKQAFSDQAIRDFSPIKDFFLNEIYFYTKVWPKFSKFQEKVPQTHHFVNLPKCFTTIPEEYYERLVLENLKYQNFVLHDKKQVVGEDMFEFIFKIYGKFHAISFAYKALNPEGFTQLTEGIYDVYEKFFEKPSFETAVKFIHEKALESLQPGVDDVIIEKYKHYTDIGMDFVREAMVETKYSALIHGDCWSNNMMFKYNDDGKLIDVRFLDFQLIRHGSPVCDLSYCLYSGGTKETFDKLDYLLQIYHDSLSESLKAYGCNPNELYPMEALKNDWRVYCQMGIMMGLSIWRGKLVYDEEVIDLTDMGDDEEKDMQKFIDAKFDKETFNQRARDIILHLYENDYLL